MEQNLFGGTTLMDARRNELPAAGGFHLLIMSPGVFSSIPLPESGTVLIGRLASAEVNIQDPQASRRHAALHLGTVVEVEDLQSANGTRLRGKVLPPATRVSLDVGEALIIGGMCLMLQRSAYPIEQGRIWSHTYFEGRLEEECERAKIAGSSFGLARIRLDRTVAWPRVLPLLVGELRPPHLLGAYGVSEYEALLSGVDRSSAEETMGILGERLRGIGCASQWGLAWFPRDGRSPQALTARARPAPKASALFLEEFAGPVDPEMTKIYEVAARAAAGSINVLVLGETGVGKEVLAQNIHRLSRRRDHAMLCLNCAGLGEQLLESELFGYEKGAFTGAVQAKPGLLETAHGGTVFLDEVAELPLVVQAKLLRVIEKREVTRLGGLKPRRLDVRFISATNCDIDTPSASFRRDLYFRLNGISITVPPLRQRPAEIPILARTFVSAICSELERLPVLGISASALVLLQGYDWPGNIRELKNVIERAIVLCGESEILPEHLPLDRMHKAVEACGQPSTLSPRSEIDPEAKETPPAPSLLSKPEMERQSIIDALATCAGNQSRAARVLGISRRTLVSRLVEYKIPRPQK